MSYSGDIRLEKEILKVKKMRIAICEIRDICRIHYQIGRIPELFEDLKEISATFWSGTHTLTNIPLRSMLVNAGVTTIRDSQTYRSGTSFNNGVHGDSQISNP